MSEESLIEIRKTKHNEFNNGKYPLPKYDYDANIKDVIRLLGEFSDYPASINPADFHESMQTEIHGRVSFFRKNGSLAFIRCYDSSGSIQLMFSKNACKNFESIKLIDLGDIIEISGFPTLSKTGEKSILVIDWNIATKAHRQPPEKFVGLTNNEIKYRKRYLDLLSSEESRAVFGVRSYTLKYIRDFMQSRDFMEVETSTLNAISSGANAKPFTTHHNVLDTELYLRIAPELYLKRLLVGGFDKVFEVGRNYRNEGMSTRHNPEFTMLESYEAFGKFDDLIGQTKSLLFHIDHSFEQATHQYVDYYLEWKKNRAFSLSDFKEVPMWDAVINAANKAEIVIGSNIHPRLHAPLDTGTPDLIFMNPSNPRLSKIDTVGLCRELIGSTSIGQKIGILFEYLAEPFLTEDYRTEDNQYSCSVFITQYPKDISPLARSIDNSTLTYRFELFIDGRELCNAFQELNDPDEQAARFREQLESNDKDPMDFDEDYIEALEYGMPPAIGFGMGIDRLIMLLTNRSNIRDVILFPTLKPENK